MIVYKLHGREEKTEWNLMEILVPSFDLAKQNEILYEELMTAIGNVIKSGQLIMGPDVVKLEKNLAAYCKTKQAIGVANGSDALYLALLAAGIGPGDEVITTPFTFFATASSIVRTGAKPVFCDINPQTFNLDPLEIEAKLTSKTKAILPVHLYGQVAEMDKINAIAKAHNLFVIEDAAQALGASYDGRPACSFGDLACLSFYPTKNLGAFGEAGMVLSSNEDLAKKVKLLRVHGSSRRYHHEILGFNCRLDTIQAAILNVKLKYLPEWLSQRKAVAAQYDEELKGVPGLITPYTHPKAVHSYHQYVIRVKNRDEIYRKLQEQGVSTMIYYPLALHLQPVFSNLGYQEGDFPLAEQATHEVLALPMYPEMTTEQVKFVSDKLKTCLIG